jgi:hypothetical protein
MAGKLKIERAVRQLILVKECREMDGVSDLQNGLSSASAVTLIVARTRTEP